MEGIITIIMFSVAAFISGMQYERRKNRRKAWIERDQRRN